MIATAPTTRPGAAPAAGYLPQTVQDARLEGRAGNDRWRASSW